MIRKLLPLVAGLTLSACPMDLASPLSSSESGIPDGLEASITVEPGEVRQHQPFVATLRVANTTDRTIRVVTAHGCLVIPNVVLDGRRVPFEGSAWGCFAAVTTHTFAPGETRVQTWDMRAELYPEHPGDVGGAPAPKGLYHVQAEFDVATEAGSGSKPAVETRLRVR